MSHKYIQHSELGFIAFKRTDMVTHADMARLMKSHRGTIVSAGFVRFVEGEPFCYGESLSLNIKSDPDDSRDFAYQLGIHKKKDTSLPTADQLAQIIRTVNGDNSLGAGVLAEKILEELKKG